MVVHDAPNSTTAPTPIEPLNLLFLDKDEELSEGSSQLASLVAGERSITIVVPMASKELVARTVVTWGFRDSNGDFVEGGRKVFTHEGGVADGRIPAGIISSEVEIRAVVDYVQAEMHDLEYTFRPTVTDAGITAVVHTSSNVLRQRLIFRTLGNVKGDDYLIAEFRSRPVNVNSDSVQNASKLFRSEQLTHAIRSIVATSVEIPLHPDDGNLIEWSIFGRLAGKQVSKTFTVENRSAIELFVNEHGQMDAWLGPENE